MEIPEGGSAESYRGTSIRRVVWAKDGDAVRRLFRDYRSWVADHRNTSRSASSAAKAGLAEIDRQIAELPGGYRPPRGEVLLAVADGEVVACGALREFEPKVAEIKRIYVRADHRGPGFGTRFTRALLRRARELHYERVRVDALSTMFAAIQFYQDLGFVRIPAYWSHPAPGVLFFEYRVRKSTPAARPRASRRPKRSRS